MSSHCHALTVNGSPCKNRPVKGLTVCAVHGGGTRSSQRKKAKIAATNQIKLWGCADSTPATIQDDLYKLINQKRNDIIALRIELSKNPAQYYGLLTDTITESGDDSVVTKKLQTHPLVQELHKSEQELLDLLKLLQTIEDPQQSSDMFVFQLANQMARILKAYPGLSAENAAKEVLKNVNTN